MRMPKAVVPKTTAAATAPNAALRATWLPTGSTYCGPGCTAAPYKAPATAPMATMAKVVCVPVQRASMGRCYHVEPHWYARAVWASDDTYGTGQSGCQYAPDVSPERAIPQNAPAVPDAMLVGPEDTMLENYAPVGIRVDAPQGVVRSVRIFPVRMGLFYASGVKSLNGPGEVEVLRVAISSDISRNAAPFDAATYATHRCFCPVDWGCCSEIDLTVRGLVPGAQLDWVLFGVLQQSLNSCYPSGGTIEHQAAAMWGMANGRDPYAPQTVRDWKASHLGTILNRRSPNPRELAENVRRYLTQRAAGRVREWKSTSSTSASRTILPSRTSPSATRRSARRPASSLS